MRYFGISYGLERAMIDELRRRGFENVRAYVIPNYLNGKYRIGFVADGQRVEIDDYPETLSASDFKKMFDLLDTSYPINE